MARSMPAQQTLVKTCDIRYGIVTMNQAYGRQLNEGAKMRERTNKAARTTRGMEIVESGHVDTRKDTSAPKTQPTKRPARENSFTIVETVTGPVAGTFGLSDVWDRS